MMASAREEVSKKKKKGTKEANLIQEQHSDSSRQPLVLQGTQQEGLETILRGSLLSPQTYTF
jgi:hypothetical protein